MIKSIFYVSIVSLLCVIYAIVLSRIIAYAVNDFLTNAIFSVMR